MDSKVSSHSPKIYSTKMSSHVKQNSIYRFVPQIIHECDIDTTFSCHKTTVEVSFVTNVIRVECPFIFSLYSFKFYLID